MKILKKENWWVWFLLFIISFGLSNFLLANLLDCYEKNKWYSNPMIWVMGILFFFVPFPIMILILLIEMITKIAYKLEVTGNSIYLSPYLWIICMIIPIFGWILFFVMYLYIVIWIILKIKEGKAEKYI